MRDLTHEICEIRRCADCFRYSYEQASSLWFAMPCIQRHELVYAKHSGFPYWPAKVIRVLPNSRYDVRFFGGNHTRASIEARNIKSIDTDIKLLKMGNSKQLKKAMDELRYHQILSTYPPSKFSYKANREETRNIINDVLGKNLQENSNPRKRGRKSKNSVMAKKQISLGNSVIDKPLHKTNTCNLIEPQQDNIITFQNRMGEDRSSQTSIIECAYGNDITIDNECSTPKRYF